MQKFSHMKLIRYLAFILFLIAAYSCSKYEKLLKSDNYQLKYKQAMEYYKKDKVVKAAGLFESIMPIYRATNKIDTIRYYHAMCEYKQGEYILAGHYFEQLVKTYPNSKFAEKADYMNAYCYYMASPRPSLDQTNTRHAIEQFQLFITRHPNNEKVSKAKRYIVELRNKLIKKSYQNARLYFDLEEYKASIIALNNCLIDFPDTRYREEILFLILKSNYLLAANSVKKKKEQRFENTVDAFNSFIDEYPDSEHIKEANRYYEQSKKYLGNN